MNIHQKKEKRTVDASANQIEPRSILAATGCSVRRRLFALASPASLASFIKRQPPHRHKEQKEEKEEKGEEKGEEEETPLPSAALNIECVIRYI